MPPADSEPRYQLLDSDGNILGSLFVNGNGNVEIQDESATGTVFGPDGVEGDFTVTTSLTDAAGVEHTGELADVADIDTVDVEDGGTIVVSGTSAINFASELTVVDDGDGSVTVNGTDTRTDVSDSGTQVVADTDDINFATDLTVTDDADGTATVSLATDAGVIGIEDDGTTIISEASNINFGSELNATDDTDGTVTASVAADVVSDGDGIDREVWVIANGASDPTGADPEDLIFEEEA